MCIYKYIYSSSSRSSSSSSSSSSTSTSSSSSSTSSSSSSSSSNIATFGFWGVYEKLSIRNPKAYSDFYIQEKRTVDAKA